MARSFRSLAQLLPLYQAMARHAGRLIDRTSQAGKAMDADEESAASLRAGMSVEEIAEELYQRDLRAGGWLFDMGLWRGLYIRRASEIINKLSGQAHVQAADPTATEPR